MDDGNLMAVILLQFAPYGVLSLSKYRIGEVSSVECMKDEYNYYNFNIFIKL